MARAGWRLTRAANASGKMFAISGRMGPCAFSSWLDVITTGRFRILAIFAKAMDCLAAMSLSMFLISFMVPTWWSMSSKAEFSAVKRSTFMV